MAGLAYLAGDIHAVKIWQTQIKNDKIRGWSSTAAIASLPVAASIISYWYNFNEARKKRRISASSSTIKIRLMRSVICY
jgi:hypothetical protein